MTAYQAAATRWYLFSGGFVAQVSFTTSYAGNKKLSGPAWVRSTLNWTGVCFLLGLMEMVPISTKSQFDPHIKVHHLMQWSVK